MIYNQNVPKSSYGLFWTTPKIWKKNILDVMINIIILNSFKILFYFIIEIFKHKIITKHTLKIVKSWLKIKT